MSGGSRVAQAVFVAGTLVDRCEVAHRIHLLEVELEGGAPSGTAPRPGQFYNIDCGGGREHLLRRPLSVHGISGWDEGAPGVRFLVEAVGWGTGRLCSLEPGARLDMLGPLGRGFTFGGAGRSLLVAGGMGVAPVFFLARQMAASGNSCDFLAGFKSAETYYSRLADLDGGLDVYTEDGSMGVAGKVSEGVRGYLEGKRYSAVYACGPEAMMAAVARVCESESIRCQVSLASRMACGIGVCRGCVREGRGDRTLCVCSDGPVFDSCDVLWREGLELEQK